jgi:Putative DNA-binding domain
MSAALAQQQQSLLQALFGPWQPKNLAADPSFSPAHQLRGLQAYRSNAHALAERALAACYPVTAQLLGANNFAAMAREFWHAHPPLRGDMGQWGEDLPAFIEQHKQLTQEPYLADVARVEWLLHQAASAADAQADVASFNLLATHDPATLGLQLAPGTQVFSSAWPVVSIIQAHQTGADAPDLGPARARMQAGVGEHALVWRQGLKPLLREADAAEAAWLQALLQGHNLPAALDAAGADFDFNTWLPQAVQSGLALAVFTINTPYE